MVAKDFQGLAIHAQHNICILYSYYLCCIPYESSRPKKEWYAAALQKLWGRRVRRQSLRRESFLHGSSWKPATLLGRLDFLGYNMQHENQSHLKISEKTSPSQIVLVQQG